MKNIVKTNCHFPILRGSVLYHIKIIKIVFFWKSIDFGQFWVQVFGIFNEIIYLDLWENE